MRYIIIPLGIIEYLLWTYFSITDLIRVNFDFFYTTSITDIWLGMHIVLVGVFLSYLIVKYW